MATDLNSEKEDTNQRSTESRGAGSEKHAFPTRTSLFKDLLSRRVPHILGGYLAASWIILEFMDWLVRRYPISPHLVEFCLVALAAMIPTVFLLAYFHGKPGPDQWTRVEKIGIPSNLVITALLLIFLFRGRDLGAITTTVSIVDEEGQQIERLIPKSEFRKKVAVFSLENESGDTTLDWLMHALPDMLGYDLMQDIYLDITSVYNFYEDLRDAGYQDAIRVPMTLKKKIAAEQYMDYFTVGKIREQDGQPSIKISLHNTRTTKLLAENAFTGKDIFAMVDEIAIWLKEGLAIPKVHTENTVDLPVVEILTNSVPALKSFYSGFNECILKENWEKGLELIEESVQEDTTFAYAYIHLYLFNIINNKTEESMQALQSLMKYLHKLPERSQFGVKHNYYYQIKQNPQMSLEVAKNWAELYPEDLQAHMILAVRYMILNQKENELAAYEKILGLDPGQYEYLLKIGEIYRDQGEFEEALEYYQLYADEFPNNSKSFTQIGDLYMTIGDYEQARSYYNKALLVEPDEISIQLSLAEIDTELGNFSHALKDYYILLENCTTSQERFDVYNSLENYFFLRGQVGKAIEYLELKIAEQEKYDVQIGILSTKIAALERYIIAGNSDRAFQIVETAEKQLGPPLDHIAPIGYLIIYLELEKVENIEESLKEVEAFAEAMQLELYKIPILLARGKLHEIKGEYDLAIQQYAKVQNLGPATKSMHYYLGRCCRLQKDYKKAEEHMQEILAIHPYWPEEIFEMGLVYADWGKNDRALEYLRKAQSIWEEADPDYKPAIESREKLAELESLNR